MQLYKAYYKAMYNTAFRILNDEFEAEDLMQEAFLTAFTKLDMYKGEVSFGAWLKKIVIHKSITQLKKNTKYIETKLEVVVDEVEVEEIDYAEMQPNYVLETINSMKENYKIALTLHLIEGYDYEEISEILDYTNENVRTTISRAKKKLQQLLLANHPKLSMYGK